jgi:hypothetical protein
MSKKTISNLKLKTMSKRIEVITPDTVDEVVGQVMSNIEQQKKKRYSIGFSVIHGEVQSGKTSATQLLCREYIKKFGSKPLITLTYPHIHLWSQVENDYGHVAATYKLQMLTTLLKNSPMEFDNLIRKHSLIIIEEAEFGNGEEGLLKQLLSALDSANNPNSNYNCHIVLIGATNYTIVYSQLLDGVSITTSHIKLPVGQNYFGPRQILDNKKLINIGDPKDGDYAVNGGKFTKKFWNLFEASFNGHRRGLAILKIKLRSEIDNTSISLCNDVIEYFNKKYPDFVIIDAYDSNKSKDYIKNRINEAQSEALISKVVLVMIDGLGAGVRLSEDLKMYDLIRFGYDTSSVGSTTAQSLVGRFSGYFYNEKGNAFKPTYTLIADEAAVEVYREHHDMLDNGELTESELSEYKKPSTNIKVSVSERGYIPAKFVEMGKISKLNMKLEDVTNKRMSGVSVSKLLSDDGNTLRECKHINSPDQFKKKWDIALSGKKESEINLLDIAYSYHMSDPKDFIYLFNNKGEYIKYKVIEKTPSIQVKKTTKNDSLYKAMS